MSHTHPRPVPYSLIGFGTAVRNGNGELAGQIADPWSCCVDGAALFVLSLFDLARHIADHASITLALGAQYGDDPAPLDEMPEALRLAVTVGNHVASDEWRSAVALIETTVARTPGDKRGPLLVELTYHAGRTLDDVLRVQPPTTTDGL